MSILLSLVVAVSAALFALCFYFVQHPQGKLTPFGCFVMVGSAITGGLALTALIG